MSAPPGKSRDSQHMALTSRREAFTCIPGVRNRKAQSEFSSREGRSRKNSRKSSKRSSVVSRKSDAESTSCDELTDHERTKSNSVDSNEVRLPKLILPDSDVEKRDGVTDTEDEIEAKQKDDPGAVSETVQDLTRLSTVERDNKSSTKRDDSNLDHAQGRRASVSRGPPKGRERSGSFLKTPIPIPATGRSSLTLRHSQPQVIQVGNHTLPAFVQVETLHPGQVFGLRACLDPEERGPIVSLVSGECEILQINKKFFMKHCDDAIYSLIRLKAKAFPSQEDLIDRLDVNMQWEEYKQRTLTDFLQRCRRLER